MTETKSPNLLIITTDQQRYDALGINGNEHIHTPNLDAIAKSGVNFSNYYVNNPVCFPSRATLFTGRYPHSHKIRNNGMYLQSDREIHLFRILKHAGYSLAYVGKNHLLRNEEFQNFDHADVWGFNHSDFWSNGETLNPAQKKYNDFEKKTNSALRQKGAWAGARFHDFPDEDTKAWAKSTSAIDFLESRPDDRPFCLYLSFYEPHAPHVAPRRYEKLYPPEEMVVPELAENELESKARRYTEKYNALKMPDAAREDYQRFISVYYGMVSFIDEQVGRVMEALREQRLLENTLIVFTSDHGDFCGEHGMVKKDTVHLDSLLHVPLLISQKGRLAEGRTVDDLAEEVDVLPTILDLINIPVPHGVQGQSLRPMIEGEGGSLHDAVYAEACNPLARNPYVSYEDYLADWRKSNDGPGSPIGVPGEYTKSVRTLEYRYVWYASGEEELYEYASDPDEQCNRAGDPELSDVQRGMREYLLEWSLKSEDPLDPKSVAALQDKYPAWKY